MYIKIQVEITFKLFETEKPFSSIGLKSCSKYDLRTTCNLESLGVPAKTVNSESKS